jgi:hypothetical protein
METIEYIRDLALGRIELAEEKARVKDLEAEMEQSDAYHKLEEARNHLRLKEAAIRGLEEGIKDRVKTEFIQGGLEDTKPYEGIQVKKFQVVRILDERAAKEWAGENAPGALSIKTSQFNKIAKALDALDFLEIDTEWRAQIASDLSMYEGDENV